MIEAIDLLRMKNAYFTPKRKAELIKSLSLDEKLLYGSYLLDKDEEKRALHHTEVKELDGELTFGNTTYEDGNETFVSNKY